MHEERLPECREKIAQIDSHIHESIPVRDMVTKDNMRITTVEKNMEKIVRDIEVIKTDISTIKTDFFRGTLTIILSIFLAVGISVFTALLWMGRYVEKIERLDNMHQKEYRVETRMP